jgi:hypothetical protein
VDIAESCGSSWETYYVGCSRGTDTLACYKYQGVTWTRFQPNFFAVFSPPTMQDAPKTICAAFEREGRSDCGSSPARRRLEISEWCRVSIYPSSRTRSSELRSEQRQRFASWPCSASRHGASRAVQCGGCNTGGIEFAKVFSLRLSEQLEVRSFRIMLAEYSLLGFSEA